MLLKWRIEPRKKGEKQECEEHEHDSQKRLTNRILEDTRRLGPPFSTKITGSSMDLLRRT
jgi:hypothetical protein